MDAQQTGLSVHLCQSLENSGKALCCTKPWALDNDMGNKRWTESCREKQGPTTLWTFYSVRYSK